MDTFINEEIEDLINSAKGGRKTAPLEVNFKKQDFSREMDNINKLYNKLINNTEYLKCLLILSLKKVSWKKELREKFDCSKTLVDYFIYYMKQNGFIVTKQLIDLDNILFETIINTNPKDFYSQSTKVNLITLTPNGEEFAKRILEDCVKLQRGDIQFTIDEINNKTKAFRFIYNKILKKENKLGSRLIEYPDGTLVERVTLRQMKLNRDCENAMLEYRKEVIIKKDPSSNQIAIIDNKKKELAKLEIHEDKNFKTRYNGIYSHLNSIELDKMSQGVTKEEEKQAEKEYKEEVKRKLNYLKYDKYDLNKVLNKEYFSYQEDKIHHIECMNLLNNL